MTYHDTELLAAETFAAIQQFFETNSEMRDASLERIEASKRLLDETAEMAMGYRPTKYWPSSTPAQRVFDPLNLG